MGGHVEGPGAEGEADSEATGDERTTPRSRSLRPALGRQVRTVLAALIDDATTARTVVADADLRPERVDFQGPLELVWFRILDEAQKCERLPQLLGVVHDRYPTNGALAEVLRQVASELGWAGEAPWPDVRTATQGPSGRLDGGGRQASPLAPRLGDVLVEGTAKAPDYNSPAALLTARYEVVPFVDALRIRELDLLRRWCDDPSPAPSVQVWVGPGGAGKTRLFLEGCRRLRQRGWVAGFLPHDAVEYIAALDARTAPVLLVLDYAETRHDQLEALLRHLGRQRGRAAAGATPCRIALLARQGGDWIASLRQQSVEADELLGAPPYALTPLPVETPLRARVFAAAANAFAEHLGKRAPAAAPDLSDARFERPLYVELAALAAVEGRPLAPDQLLEDAVNHERHFWKTAQGGPDARAFQRSASRLVAALTLRGRTERHEVAALDGQVKGPGLERFHDLVADLYPAPAERGRGQVGGLEPDLLGEALVGGVLSAPTTERAYLEQVARGAGEGELATMLQVLGRIDRRSPEVTEPWLKAFLAADCAGRALPAWRAALALAEETAYARLGQLLAERLANEAPYYELAQTLDHEMPEYTVSLRELAVWALRARLSALPATEASRAERGRLQNNLGLRLGELGQREEALEATREAVEHHRALAKVRPDAFLPDLAGSLANLGNRLSALGQREEALEATREAVELRRALAKAHPDTFLPDLASSLNNLGIWLSELGQREEALEATREAVEHHRALAKVRPDAFLPDLAGSLANLGNRLSALGQREEALEAAREAVELRRALAKARPDAFLPHLATSLNNLSVGLSEVGHREEALEATREAVELRRALAKARPDAFLPDLAMSLNNLGGDLNALGQRDEALEATREAVEHYRVLAKARPDAFLPDLAMSLNNLGIGLNELGHREEALEATREAVELRRALAKARPDAFLPDLAMSLNNLGGDLNALGQRDEALEATREAVELHRALAKARPDAFLPYLAMSLNNLGGDLNALGQREEALEATREAVEFRRALVKARPDAFLPDLASSLNNLGIGLGALGHLEAALEATREAVEHYRALAKARPDAFLPDLAMSLNNLNVDLGALGHREEALEATREAVEHYRALAKARPDAFLPYLAMSLNNLGVRFSALGQREEALEATREAVEHHRALAKARPDAFLPGLAMSLSNLGIRLSALGQREEALEATREAVELRRTLAKARPDAFLPDLALSLNNLGVDLSALGQHNEALSAGREGVELYRRLFRARPRAFKENFSISLQDYADCLTNAGLDPSTDETYLAAAAALASHQAT